MRTVPLLAGLILLTGACLPTGALGQASRQGVGAGPPPTLCLEAGVHTAPIRALSLSRDGHLALTASEDKTARLWAMPGGRLLRTFRPRVGAGNTGKLYACALTPDGALAALAGWTMGGGDPTSRVLLVDARTGALLRALDVGDQAVTFMAMAPDGRRLAVHTGARGLWLLRLPDGAVLGRDTDFTDVTYRGAFDAQGRYAATAEDGFVRLYDRDFHRLLKVLAPGPAPFGLAFSPDGALLALGHADAPEVEVLRASDLSLAYRPARGSQPLGLVAWSPDGETLYGSGGQDYGATLNVMRRWSDRGRGAATETPLARATVSELLALPDGGLAFAAQDPVWGALDRSGRPLFQRRLREVDLRKARDAFQVSPDAREVFLPGGFGGPGWFSLTSLELQAAARSKGLRLHAGGPRVTGWEEATNPSWGGFTLELEPFELSHSVAYLPRGAGFLLGTDFWFRCFDSKGQERWRSPLPAPAWGLGLGAEGRVAVAMLSDGSCRWLRVADGQVLLSLFVAPDGRWVVWTPSGHFATSVGGEGLVGWQVDGQEPLGAFFPLSQFRDPYYRPDLVSGLLDAPDEAAALGKLPARAEEAPPPASLRLPPVLTRLESRTGPQGAVELSLTLRTYGPAPAVRAFRLSLDGQRLGAGPTVEPAATHRRGDGEERSFALHLAALPRSGRLGIQAELEDGRRSEWLETDVALPQPAAPAGVPGGAPGGAPAVGRTPALQVLAVGISAFAKHEHDLLFSAKDATDVAACFRAQEGRLFSKVDVRLLTDAQATGEGITSSLEDLAGRSRPDDVTVVFFSTHGVTDEARRTYALVPHDFEMGSLGVPGPVLQRCLEAIQGKVLVLLDTCHSGNVLGQDRMRSLDDFYHRARFINELIQAGPGMVVLSSSTGDQVSLERQDWGNGAFTKALREGLAGAADPDRTGRVTTALLDAWLRHRVAELTDGKQTPVAGKSERAQAFPVALVPSPR